MRLGDFLCFVGTNSVLRLGKLVFLAGNYFCDFQEVAFYLELLKTGLGILDFYHSGWLNGARLSAHIPAVTKYGQ